MNNLYRKGVAIWIGYILLFFMTGCDQTTSNKGDMMTRSDVPSWAAHAIWYQIFVERFYNGSDANNPDRESLLGAWPDSIPDTWALTPWTQQWYQPDPWFEDCAEAQFYHGVQARRYGGDLIGVRKKMDYLSDLGITAVYFNPLNYAPSMHKYDPTAYHHIDPYFGPDPSGDITMMQTENPGDPSTWVWTSADKLFLEIIEQFHHRGIRVIMDYSWNHTGRTFWAFKDVLNKKENSDYYDWYYVSKNENKSTGEIAYDFQYWFGASTLPELREDLPNGHLPDGRIGYMEGNLHSASLKAHIKAVSKRWLDPTGSGDLSKGVDGFRMDVAAEIPAGWWSEYRAFVKSVNPDALLIGELWYEKGPDDLLDPTPFFEDGFDACMNYRWYRSARKYFAQAEGGINADQFIHEIQSQTSQMNKGNQYAMMNLISSHDTPRALTSLFNKGKYKYQAKPSENPSYKTYKPDPKTYQDLKLLLAHQYTFIGAPHIWNGDEMGMWGADDPDCRKPLWWPEFSFEKETMSPLGNEEMPQDEVVMNEDVYQQVKSLIQLRKAHPVLASGQLTFISDKNLPYILAYKRFNDLGNEIIVAFNKSDQPASIYVESDDTAIYVDYQTNEELRASNDHCIIHIDPNDYRILIKKS